MDALGSSSRRATYNHDASPSGGRGAGRQAQDAVTEAIKRRVDQAPPLTAGQFAALRLIFAPTRDALPAQRAARRSSDAA